MPGVVLFKSESDGPDKFVKVLEDNNFAAPISINCLDFRFKNLDLLKERLKTPDEYEGIIFTSPRAVHGVAEIVKDESEITNSWNVKSNFCVGESTSELSQRLLKLSPLGKESGNAQNLATFIISRYEAKAPTKSFLFPSGNLKQDILEKSLKDRNLELEALEIYETCQHPTLDKSIEDLNLNKVDFFVFFSPSGIKFSHPLLVKHQIDLENIKLIAIGPSTKKAIEELGLKCHQTCTKPSPESLIEALS